MSEKDGKPPFDDRPAGLASYGVAQDSRFRDDHAHLLLPLGNEKSHVAYKIISISPYILLLLA